MAFGKASRELLKHQGKSLKHHGTKMLWCFGGNPGRGTPCFLLEGWICLQPQQGRGYRIICDKSPVISLVITLIATPCGNVWQLRRVLDTHCSFFSWKLNGGGGRTPASSLKYETITQGWFNVGPASQTMGQHRNNFCWSLFVWMLLPSNMTFT